MTKFLLSTLLAITTTAFAIYTIFYHPFWITRISGGVGFFLSAMFAFPFMVDYFQRVRWELTPVRIKSRKPSARV